MDKTIEQINVLLIEKKSAHDSLIKKNLLQYEAIAFSVSQVTTLSDIKTVTQAQNIDIILLDLNLADTQGIETIVTAHMTIPELPIIILANEENDDLSVTTVQAGAQDYLLKPKLDAQNLIRSIRYALERNRLTLTLNELNKQQQYLATHDILTGLPNRELLYDRISQSLAFSHRYQQLFAVLFIDLDNFKMINDSLGHDFGDEILRMTAERLSRCIRSTDTIARLGGDEFTILLNQLNHIEATTTIAQNILQIFYRPFVLHHQEIYMTASIGISIYPDDGHDTKTLLKNADAAMYNAKEKGKNNFQYYKAELQASSYKQLTLANSLHRALEHQEFMLHFQPQFNTYNGKVIGVEALLRWQHPKLGFISPIDFIPVAEETGLIVPIGKWVLYQACIQYLTWQKQGLAPDHIAVNLSIRQFETPKLTNTIMDILNRTGLSPEHLDLEITESIIMKNPEDVTKTLLELKNIGIHISIDDFGTGYSSLNYLKHLPADTLKIDRSFVHNLSQDESNAKIVNAIIALANSLNMDVIAEGVETESEKKALTKHGCFQMQGYLFCHPLSVDDTTHFLHSKP